MKIIHILIGKVIHLNANKVSFFLSNSAKMDTYKSDHVFIVFQDYKLLNNKEKNYYIITDLSPNQLIFLNPSKYNIFKIFLKISKKDIIILHSARQSRIWIVLSLMPWLWKRTALIIWGGEHLLFKKHRDTKNAKGKILWLCEKIIIPNLSALCTLTPGEFKGIQSIFKNSDNYFRAFYGADTFNEPNQMEMIRDISDQGEVRILLNQSAHTEGRHIEALNWMAKFKDENIKIICPLSYGPKEEVERITQFGKEKFGEKFETLTELIPKNDYVKFINGIDLLVLNHIDQSAIGHLRLFLSRGKIIYMREESPVYKMLKDFHIKVIETKSISTLSYNEFIKPYSIEIAKNNIQRFEEHLSIEASITSWKRLFNHLKSNKNRKLLQCSQ